MTLRKKHLNQLAYLKKLTEDELNPIEELPITDTSFNVNHFKELKSFNQRIAYARKFLTRLGSGSSRIVFKIDNDKALKLAKNKKGIEQNSVENDFYIQEEYGDIISKILEYDSDDLWIISELAKKISPSIFEQKLGYSLPDFYMYLNNRVSKQKGKELTYTLTSEVITPIENSEFAQQVFNLTIDFNMLVGDFGRISSYGEVNGRIVLIDYGLTNTVYKNSYNEETIRNLIKEVIKNNPKY